MSHCCQRAIVNALTVFSLQFILILTLRNGLYSVTVIYWEMFFKRITKT